MSLADLQSQVSELRLREASIRNQFKRYRAKQSRASKPLDCTPWMKAVAVRIWALADVQAGAGRKYLRAKKRVASEADVREWYTSLSAEARAGLLSPPVGDKAAARQVAEARRFIDESQLIAWVREQNTRKGIAPIAGAVLRKAGPTIAKGKHKSNRYRWLRRCMSRWGGRRARFAHGDSLTTEEMQEKAMFPLPDLHSAWK